MSKTPNFDARMKAMIDALPEGKDAEICRKFQVPLIGMGPQKQMAYMNGFNTGLAFFWKPHMLTGKPLLSAIHPDHPIQVVSDEEWASADYTSLAQDVDASQKVMDQLWDLVTRVPHNPTRSVQAINSVVVGTINAQDSYIVSAGLNVNRCFYGYALMNGEDCVDSGNGIGVRGSYKSGGSNEISNCQFVYECKACLDSSFLFDCWNCDNCFGATNQRNKRFIFFNEQLSEEEYRERVSRIDLSDTTVAEEYRQKFLALWKRDGVWPEAMGYGNTEAVGEHVFGCVRSDECFWMSKSTDCFRCRFGVENSGCAYTSGSGYEQDCYMCTGGTNGLKNKFCLGSPKCVNCEYCHNCTDCENCFGCSGLHRKQFCIFNKQYSEEEYWPLVDQLKCRMLDEGSYGAFFPAKFAPCGFQYSAGQMYNNYTEAYLREFDAPTFDPRRGQAFAPHQAEVQPIAIDDLPLRLADADPSTFVGKPIHDPEVDRNFTILPAEFAIYQAKRWPLPRKHFVTRLTELIRLSNSPLREDAVCGSCQQAMTTYKNFTFAERKVYCNACYLKFLETR